MGNKCQGIPGISALRFIMLTAFGVAAMLLLSRYIKPGIRDKSLCPDDFKYAISSRTVTGPSPVHTKSADSSLRVLAGRAATCPPTRSNGCLGVSRLIAEQTLPAEGITWVEAEGLCP